jgi:predicted  nucleic acid-binding Zn-ribbon protein
MDSLKAQAEAMEQELQAIRQRIGDLEAQGKKG